MKELNYGDEGDRTRVNVYVNYFIDSSFLSRHKLSISSHRNTIKSLCIRFYVSHKLIRFFFTCWFFRQVECALPSTRNRKSAPDDKPLCRFSVLKHKLTAIVTHYVRAIIVVDRLFFRAAFYYPGFVIHRILSMRQKNLKFKYTYAIVHTVCVF